MFFLKQDDLYWDGENWVENWREAKVYGSAAIALYKAPNSSCKATGLNQEQWVEYYNCIELKNEEKN